MGERRDSAIEGSPGDRASGSGPADNPAPSTTRSGGDRSTDASSRDAGPTDDLVAVRNSSRIAGTIATAIACFAFGRLVLWIVPADHAIPAVWPGAGIALAAVLLLGPVALIGVAAGTFAAFLSLQMPGAASHLLHLPARPVLVGALTISTCVQTMLAARLVRSCLDPPDPLSEPRDITRFLLIAVLCCGVNASVGTAVLVEAGTVARAGAALSVYAWWVAEAIGVVVMTPIVLSWFARPASSWKPRRILVSTPLLVASLIVLLAYYSASARESDNQERAVERVANTMLQDLRVRLGQCENILLSVERFYAASEFVAADEFQKFVELPLRQYPEFVTLAFIEVRPNETDEPSYAILYAESRSDAAAPSAVEAVALETLRPMLHAARDSGEARATGRVDLAPDGLPGIMIGAPIYGSRSVPPTRDERRDDITGFAVGALRVEPLVDEALRNFDLRRIEAVIEDASGSDELYHTSASVVGTDQQKVSTSAEVRIGGRSWTVHITAARPRAWLAWWLLGAGLWLTAILGAFLLLITGRSTAIERLVRERTAQLSTVNEQLGEEIDEHMETEKRLRSHAYQLERSNEELDTLTYIASNDLRPYFAELDALSRSLIDQADTAAEIPAGCVENLARIRERVGGATTLLDQLLQYSKVNRVTYETEPVEVQEMLHDSIAAMDIPDGFRLSAHGLPFLEAERVPLNHVFGSLIANSIAHHDRDRGRIDIHCRPAGELIEFTVEDDGPGIAPHIRRNLLDRYQPSTDGPNAVSRLGLALVRKIVEQRGGTITIETGASGSSASTAGASGEASAEMQRGTRVRFTWPYKPPEDLDAMLGDLDDEDEL